MYKFLFCVLLLLQGCFYTGNFVLEEMGEHAFPLVDRSKVLRAVITAMQQQGYEVQEANEVQGVIKGSKQQGMLVATVQVLYPQDEQIKVLVAIHYQDQLYKKAPAYKKIFHELSRQLL